MNSSTDTSHLFFKCPRCKQDHIKTHITCPENGGFVVGLHYSKPIKIIYIWLLRTSLGVIGALIGYFSFKDVGYVYLSDIILILFALMLRFDKPIHLQFVGLYLLACLSVLILSQSTSDLSSKITLLISLTLILFFISLLTFTFFNTLRQGFDLAITCTSFFGGIYCLATGVAIHFSDLQLNFSFLPIKDISQVLTWVGTTFIGGVLIGCLSFSLFNTPYTKLSTVFERMKLGFDPSRIPFPKVQNPSEIQGNDLAAATAKIVTAFTLVSVQIAHKIALTFYWIGTTLANVILDSLNVVSIIAITLGKLLLTFITRLIIVLIQCYKMFVLQFLRRFILPFILYIFMSLLLLNFDTLLYDYVVNPQQQLLGDVASLLIMIILLALVLLLGIISIWLLLGGNPKNYFLTFFKDFTGALLQNFIIVFFFTQLVALISNWLFGLVYHVKPVFTVGPVFVCILAFSIFSYFSQLLMKNKQPTQDQQPDATPTNNDEPKITLLQPVTPTGILYLLILGSVTTLFVLNAAKISMP